MPGPLMDNRRSAVEIVHEILSVCGNGGINKTAIMYRSSLSYDQLRRYLSMLCDDGLLARNDLGLFHITDMGQKTLGRMSGAIKALRDLRVDFKVAGVPASG